MHIEINADNLLIQLGYPENNALKNQMERVLANTVNFDTFSRHILSLKDELEHYDGYIAMSNSKDYLKIKTDSTNPDAIAAYNEILDKWSSKYKVDLENVPNTNTYYIIGQTA